MYHINKEITGSGENIALKNTARHYYKDFGILGNSKQETREGYNILNFNVTQNEKVVINDDGTMTINGSGGFSLKHEAKNVKAGKTYTYKWEIVSGTVEGANVFLENGSSVWLTPNKANLITITEDRTISSLWVHADAIFTNAVIRMWAVLGSEKPYEQYGASPSIKYEAPIESVGDNINEFNKDDSSKILSSGVDGNTLKITSNESQRIFYIECEPNTNYTISKLASTRLQFWDSIEKPAVGVTLNSVLNTDYIFNGTEKTIKTSSNAKYLVCYYYYSATDTLSEEAIRNSIKICKGTKATPYSPYGQGSITVVNSNENFFDISKLSSNSKNGIALTKNDNGTVTLNGTASEDANFDFYITDIKATTNHKLQLFNLGGSYTNNYVSVYMATDNTWNDFDMLALTTNKITVMSLKEKTYTYARVKVNKGVVCNNLVIGCQIINDIGETPTEYIPHQSQTKALYTQQPLESINELRDNFLKNNNLWYEKHYYSKKVITGDESWTYVQNTKTWYVETFFTDKLSGSNIKSTHYPSMLVTQTAEMTDKYIGAQKSGSNINRIYIKDTENAPTTSAEFKAWVKSLNITVYYELATPTLIECTPEQIEQLEYFEKEAYSYDEVTHIYSTNEVSPYFEVTAYQRISEEFKTRLKEGKITRGYLKVLANDIYPEIIIDENNYLKDLKIEELRYVPEEGFIGGTVAKRVSGNFNNVDSSFNIQDREIEVYLGVELEDETTEYINYGTYIVQRPEDNQVNDNTSFEALDYMIKFNLEYEDRVTYPCTLKELFDDIVDQAAVTSKVATFPNADFIVEDNQFETGTTLRDVLKAIAQMAFNWTRIDQDNNLVMDFEIKATVDEELEADDYFNYTKSDYYGPINTLILRNSQVEGENITIKDEELINSPKGYNILNTSGFIKNNLSNVEVTRNEDGSFTINGTTETNGGDIRIIYKKPLIIPAGDCTFTYGINGLNMFNNEVNLSSLGKGTYMAIRRMAVSSSKTTLTFENDFEIYNYNIHLNPNTTFNNLTIKPMIYKGHDEKQFQPYIPLGEIEYVISDNPFAYTEAKRAELIEAGRKLFGLKYTPMSMDMIGFMYLNAKDRIAATNLNGETFYTYLLNHTIDYTGVVLDSMESPAKTKTETKYQFTPQMIQLLKHTEIKVDKANQEISLVAEKQEGLESTVAEQKISLEEIRTGLTKVEEVVERTVARVEVVYALSDSSTVAPTDGWSTTAPEWVEGKYMWQKTITTYSDGTQAETAATNISGAQGKDGISGMNGANSYSYVAFANSADGSVDFSRTDSTDKTYIGTLTINESVNENILRNTNRGTTNWGFATQNGVVSKEQYTEEGKNAVKLICTTASTGWQYGSYYIGTDTLKRLKENTSYILSFDIKTNIGPSTLEVALKRGDSTNTIAQGVKADILGDETWEHFSVQLKTISDFSNITIGSQVVYFIGMNKVGYYIIENLKLEEGYRESSYSKSPEDLANDYKQYYWQYTKGEEGVGVKAVVDEYYLSTSNTEQTGGEWQQTQPQWEEGNYIWTRTKITWTNDSITYTDPILANTLNDINSNIIVLREFNSEQVITNQGITSSVSDITKRLNNDYLTAEQTNSKIDGIDGKYETLEQRVTTTETTASGFDIRIQNIEDYGVDKITTSIGYTFNDNGLNINRENADTGTVVDETGIQVIDKTGANETNILYAGYVKEGNTKYGDYVGQTIVATSNLIVKTYLVIGSNSRFQDYINPALGGQGTGAFDI